jgi:hypothetical protein
MIEELEKPNCDAAMKATGVRPRYGMEHVDHEGTAVVRIWPYPDQERPVAEASDPELASAMIAALRQLPEARRRIEPGPWRGRAVEHFRRLLPARARAKP